MKKTLLLLVMIFFITGAFAQKRKKTEQPLTGYAITAVEKGGRNWKEVRLINITTGEEIKTIYQSKQETEVLNARTGKQVVKKDMDVAKAAAKNVEDPNQVMVVARRNDRDRNVDVNRSRNRYDEPFATNSAAMAYDRKHERLYYTPMGINQLRYIDLRSNKIYYFENEPFGSVPGGGGDGAIQVTRMVIAADGNGYALTNDANHLVRFTTGKDPVITDLGPLSDNAGNANFSVHSRRGFGGDMIADAAGNLYLLMANRNIFKIVIDSKIATYQGTIKGLPDGFTTNGAMVEEGSKVIVASAESAIGYYRFDLLTMQAEKVSTQGSVYNASDLANERLAFSKKKKDKKITEPLVQPVTEESSKRSPLQNAIANNGISVYPNPVTNGFVKVSFADQAAGKYSVELIDITGKLIQSREININSSTHVEEIRIARSVSGGNYLLKITGINNNVSFTSKLVVQ